MAGLLLSATSTLTVALGIANVYARDAMTTAAAQKTLAEAYPGRFLLGLGVSSPVLVEKVRGHDYGKPLSYMKAYLEAMDRAPFNAVGRASRRSGSSPRSARRCSSCRPPRPTARTRT